MVISLMWIVAMRLIAGPMVWIGLVAVIGLLSYGQYNYAFFRFVRSPLLTF